MANTPAIYQWFGIYGVALDVYFATGDVTDVNDLYQGTAWAAGDAQISKDGGAEAATTNTPARITAFHHKLTLTAAEMSAKFVFITIRDQTEPEVFEPVVIQVITRLQLGEIKADATQIGGNVSAIEATGVGNREGLRVSGGATGAGMACLGSGGGAGLTAAGGTTGPGIVGTGGATSGNGIQGVAGAPNGNGLAVSGLGTGHGILSTGGLTGYGIAAVAGATGPGHGIYGAGAGAGHGFNGVAGGTGKICNLFDTLEGTEPGVVPANNSSFATILQLIKRRMFNKKTATSAVLTQFKDDSATALFTESLANDGTTVTEGKAA